MLQATAETITTQKSISDPKFKEIVGEIWNVLEAPPNGMASLL